MAVIGRHIQSKMKKSKSRKDRRNDVIRKRCGHEGQ